MSAAPSGLVGVVVAAVVGGAVVGGAVVGGAVVGGAVVGGGEVVEVVEVVQHFSLLFEPKN